MKTEFKDGILWEGDCLELMKDIPDGSVDMVLCDLPYGTTQNKWDSVIPFEPLWEQYWRVLKSNGAVVLTAAQPFTSVMVMSQIEYFKYEWVWDKVNKYSNYMNAKRQPMRRHENICVFYRKQSTYNRQMKERADPWVTRKTASPKSDNYGDFDKKDVGRIRTHDAPCSVIDIKGAMTSNIIHPTQKPVALFEYLIKTYTNEGETVLDNCSGSGTTAIAARNTNRRFICIEKDPDYVKKSLQRIENHIQLEI